MLIWSISLPPHQFFFFYIQIKGVFSNVILVTLFKCCENTCELKNVVKICIILFKQQKLLFK